MIISCGVFPEENNTLALKEISGPNVFQGEHKPAVMILGVFHFFNPGLDFYKQQFNFDILEEKRQQELEVVLKNSTI